MKNLTEGQSVLVDGTIVGKIIAVEENTVEVLSEDGKVVFATRARVQPRTFLTEG